jgi:hypothetical protein
MTSLASLSLMILPKWTGHFFLLLPASQQPPIGYGVALAGQRERETTKNSTLLRNTCKRDSPREMVCWLTLSASAASSADTTLTGSGCYYNSAISSPKAYYTIT